MGNRSMGVEEELLIVDAVTARPRALATAVLRQSHLAPGADSGGTVGEELKQEQIEVDTLPCTELADLREAIVAARRRVGAAAEAFGAEVAALATAPLAAETHTTVKPRYLKMADFFGVTEWEYLTCGCHVHVNVGSRDEGVAVLDRIRGWLPVILAISANSPFSQGVDTRYHSYRSQMVYRWPTAGPTELFGTAESYDAAVRALIESGAAMDTGMVYFDARLSEKYPTVEIRVADVCLDANDTVLVAALVRALVETAARAAAAGTTPPLWRTDLLRAAAWWAARHGITGDLVDPRTQRRAAARSVVEALIAHVTPALRDAGDLAEVHAAADRLFRRGTGSTRQRAVYAATGDLTEVVLDAVRATAA